MCKAGCMTQEVKGACPPGIELRIVDATGNVMSPQHSPCKCSDESDVLNCGGGTTLYGRPDTGKQKCYARDSGRADEPMVIAIPEIRDIHQWHGCKCDMRNANNSIAAPPASAVPAAAPTSSPVASPASPISLDSAANATAANGTAANSTAANSTAANSALSDSTVSAAAVATKPASEPPNYYLGRGVDGEPLL
jgi:hypothetical protein